MSAVTKKTIVNIISEQVEGQTKKSVDEIVGLTFEVIRNALVDGDKVSIHGFGSFATKQRKERQGRNPQTGKALTIPARKAVNFTPAQQTKDAIN